MPEQKTLPLEIVKINDGAYRIEDNGVRALLFIGSEKAMLVDTGFGGGESIKAVTDKLTDKPVMLVTSHADGDHIGRNAEFGVAHMHPAEFAHYHNQDGRADDPVAALWDGDVIDLGGRQFEVILIPGHTPGSIALLDRANRVIVTGDSVSEGPVFMFGDARDLSAYISSMERLQSLAGDFDEIYPSHGPFPILPAQIAKAAAAAKALLAGQIEPQEPPFPLPAKLYMIDGAGFFR